MSYTAHSEMNPITMQVSTTGLIIRDSDGAIIPPDPANTDYQQYLEWLEDGNVPEEWNPEEVN